MSNWLEAELRVVARRLHNEQLARLWKIPNDIRLMPGKEVVHGDQQPADFFGYTTSARAILIECKVRNADSFDASTLRPHQRRALDELHRANGIALIAWGREIDKKCRFVSVFDLDMLGLKNRSLRWGGIHAAFRAPLDGLFELIARQIAPSRVA